MRLYRRVRRVGGKLRESKHVHLDFEDHDRAPRTLTLFTDDSVSSAFAAKLDRLIAARMAHEPLTGDLCLWLERMPDHLRGKLAEWGILDSARAASGKPLREHVDDFEAGLTARGATDAHAQLTANRKAKVIYTLAKEITESAASGDEGPAAGPYEIRQEALELVEITKKILAEI